LTLVFHERQNSAKFRSGRPVLYSLSASLAGSACLIMPVICCINLVWWRGVVGFGWNKVTLRQARLVLWWVTACGQVNHLGVKPAS